MDDGDAKVLAKDNAGAVVAYQKAHEIMHVPTTGVELARSYERVGRLVEARDVALEVLRMPALANEPGAFQKARVEAARLAESISPRLASLVVESHGAAEGTVVRIAVDGKAIPDAAQGVPLAADPGRHVVEAVATGYTTVRQEIVASEGSRVPVRLELVPDGTAAPPQVAPPAAPPSRRTDVAQGGNAMAGPAAGPPGEGKSRIRPVTLVTLGVGGAALVAGTVAGVVALSKTAALKDVCPNDRCPPEQADALSSARTVTWVSNIGLLVGVAASAVGTYFLISDLSSSKKATGQRVAPLLGASADGGFVGISGRL
jgi:hypothetical protein